MNASPAADTPPALLAYDAELELVSAKGSRWVSYAQFHKGYKQMDLAPGELLSRDSLAKAIQGLAPFLPKGRNAARPGDFQSLFCGREARRRNENRARQRRARVPLLVRSDLSQEISPIDDIRSTARYRYQVAQNLMDEFLRST